VLVITGNSHVALRNIRITHGEAGGGDGGGMAFAGKRHAVADALGRYP
jgi:hypothetical protein